MIKKHSSPEYIGRFAPSPSGPLHFGSMFCALGSYLQAKSNQGKWLLRIEDVDPPREVKGAANKILTTLENHGLFWDDNVLYQRNQSELYEHALANLNQNSLLFNCDCSRKRIQKIASPGLMGHIYPGTCRNKVLKNVNGTLRIKTKKFNISFNDLLQGKNQQNIATQIGDIILKRENGLYAYQLAVVIDDNFQKITEVVRGFDLFNSTPIQIYLQKILQLSTPDYLHIPILVDHNKNKLSKQARAKEVDGSKVEKNLFFLLCTLAQNPPEDLQFENKENILNWAIENWNYQNLINKKEIVIDTNR